MIDYGSAFLEGEAELLKGIAEWSRCNEDKM
jgi:hypothetical protein